VCQELIFSQQGQEQQMDNKPKQNNMGQGGQKPGFEQDRQQRGSQSGQRNEQAGFQHEPKPGVEPQNKNVGGGQGQGAQGQSGGQGRQAAQPRQGSRDENR
jgi:hypothetical protein